jgi:hypothetical protein
MVDEECRLSISRNVSLIRTDVSEECQFIQEPHGVISHKAHNFKQS